MRLPPAHRDNEHERQCEIIKRFKNVISRNDYATGRFEKIERSEGYSTWHKNDKARPE